MNTPGIHLYTDFEGSQESMLTLEYSGLFCCALFLPEN